MEDGLSYRHVTAVVQDHQGLMWIGTRDGLNKFDGYNFTVYSDRKTEDTPAISNNYVHDLSVDRNGKIWIATETGLSVLSPLPNTVKNYDPKEVFPQTKFASSIDEVTITQHSKRVFVHTHETKTFDKLYTTSEFVDGAFRPLIFDYKGQSFQYIANIFEDDQKRLWVRPAMHSTFYQLDANNKVISTIELPNFVGELELFKAFPELFTPSENSAFVQNQEFIRVPTDGLVLNGSFCDGDSTYLIRCDLTNQTYNRLPRLSLGGELMPLNQFVDAEENLWIQFHDNYLVQSNNGHQTLITNEDPLLAKNTTCFFQSNEGTVWIGTHFGLIRVRKTTIPFTFGLNTPENSFGYGRSLRGLSNVYKGWVYAGAVNDGLWRYHLKSGKVEQVLPKEIQSNLKKHIILPYALEVQDGALWICNWFDDGILRYDLVSEELKHIKAPDNEAGFARTLLKRKDSKLWLGTDKGLNLLDPKNNKVNRFQPRKAPKEFRDLSISVLAHSSQGKLWIGTKNQGVYLLDNNNEVMLYHNKSKNLINNIILSINDNGKYLWIGTASGLCRINLKDKSTRIYSERDGLPNTHIYAIQEMNSVLWLSTDKGICRFDPITESCINYGKQEGIPHEEFNYASFRKLNASSILFGSMNGMVRIDAEKVRLNPKNYPIVLTQVERFSNEENRIKSYRLRPKEGLDIYHDDKFFTVHFAMLDLFSSDHINYAYKLEGYDDQWINIGKANNIRFNQLPAGNYTLVVRAQGSNGAWNKKTLRLPIRVHQVFYKTWWFITLIILFTTGLIYVVLEYRRRQRNKLQLLRLKIASDLHDDVGGVLTQIGMQAELIKEGIYDAQQQKEQVNQIATNSRDAVRAMSDVLWSIDIREEKMHDLIARMKGYALEMMATKNVDVQFQIGDLEDKRLDLDFRQNVYLAFKEMINNIVKHSNATEVLVIIEKNNHFVLKVSDNGTVKDVKPIQGQGLRNLKMRAERIGGTIKIQQEDGFHVTFIV